MSLLTTLPPEVRSEIFSYILASPTGEIILKPIGTEEGRFQICTTAETTIFLTFLRTCKQIHAENMTLDSLWKANTLILDHRLNVANIPSAIASRVQHLALDFAFLGWDKYTYDNRRVLKLEHDFIHLRNSWKSLTSLALIAWPAAVWKAQHDMHWALRNCCFHRRDRTYYDNKVPPFEIDSGESLYVEIVETLREARNGQTGYFKDLERGIKIDSGQRVFNDAGAPTRVFWERGELMPSAEANGTPNDMLADWAGAFGGTLELDGVLCYRAGKRLRPAFFPEEWEPDIVRTFYKIDVDIWQWAKERKRAVGGDLKEHAETISRAYWEGGIERVSELLGHVAAEADAEVLKRFKELYCK